jgi:hypothetical protein
MYDELLAIIGLESIRRNARVAGILFDDKRFVNKNTRRANANVNK